MNKDTVIERNKIKTLRYGHAIIVLSLIDSSLSIFLGFVVLFCSSL